MAYKIIIVDDEKRSRKMLSDTVKAKDGYEILLETTSGATLLESDLSEGKCLFLDLSIEDKNGTAIVAPLREKYPSLKILVISSKMDGYILRKLMIDGIKGYILKDDLFPPDLVFRAIEEMEAGRYFFSEEVEKEAMAILRKYITRAGEPDDKDRITKHLWAVGYYVTKGLTETQIGGIMKLSSSTVAGHKARLADFLGLGSRKELVGELSKEPYQLLMIDAVRDKKLPIIED